MKKALWLMGFLIIALISGPEEAVAMVSCEPTFCTPGCDDSCTYQACIGTEEQTLTIHELPFTITLPDAACAGDTPTFHILPIPHEGDTYHTLPAEVTDSYNICETVTVSGEPCPPPEPPKEEFPKK